ncbi:hypothetical protein BDW62DRAFT_90972 [Aspergillus aurantiobrunneus]
MDWRLRLVDSYILVYRTSVKSKSNLICLTGAWSDGGSQAGSTVRKQRRLRERRSLHFFTPSSSHWIPLSAQPSTAFCSGQGFLVSSPAGVARQRREAGSGHYSSSRTVLVSKFMAICERRIDAADGDSFLLSCPDEEKSSRSGPKRIISRIYGCLGQRFPF